MNRRKLLICGVGASIGLAGCSAIPGDYLVSNSDSSGEGESASDSGTQNVSRETSGSDESEAGKTITSETGSVNRTEDEATTVELEQNEPTAVVKVFYEALYALDVETANNLLHPDSPETLYSEEAVARFEVESHTFEHVRVVEEDGGTAVVAFVLVLVDPDGEERRTDMRVELRMDGEEWKIWEPK